MKSTTKHLLVAAIAAMPLTFATTALAQFQTGQDGRALDASNRVGSGAMNAGTGIRSNGINPNDIVYGNVTAGRGFRGNINTFDPRQFQGANTSGNYDNIIRNTSGAPVAGNPGSQVNLSNPQTFYGSNFAVPPPGSANRVGTTNTFVGTGGDSQRIDRSLNNIVPGSINYAQPGALVMPTNSTGPIQNQSVLTGSPLYGVREVNLDDPYLADMKRQTGAAGDLMSPDQKRLAEMQRELQNLNSPDKADPNNAGLNNALQKPFESPENARLGQQTQSQTLTGSTPLTGDMNTADARRLPTASQQSTQYAELERRLQRYKQVGNQADNDIRATRPPTAKPDDAQPKAIDRPNQPVQPRTPGAPATPPAGNVRPPVAPAPAPAPVPSTPPAANAKPDQEVKLPADLPKPGEAPLQVKSLADGIQAEGLKNVMLKAEENMKEGKFRDALLLYTQAEEIAPNNPLVQLGKVNALLGSTSFARAYPTLRNTIAADPAVLLAQYDLKGMYGEKNLARIVKELKFVADVEKNSPEAMFLLAYVAYNSGGEELAAGYLQKADERSGGSDKVVQLLKQYWALPKAQDANK